MVNFQIRSALQFHEFSSKMVNFQIRSEGCRVVSVGRSVADSLFRPHPEQRARASREPLKDVMPRYMNLPCLNTRPWRFPPELPLERCAFRNYFARVCLVARRTGSEDFWWLRGDQHLPLAGWQDQFEEELRSEAGLGSSLARADGKRSNGTKTSRSRDLVKLKRRLDA